MYKINEKKQEIFQLQSILEKQESSLIAEKAKSMKYYGKIKRKD
jgi:hypothetical protein